MRTTISIEDNLLVKLKERAAETGSTVSRLIEEAVKVMMNRKAPESDEPVEFELVTFGAGGQFTRYNIDKTSSLLAAGDLEKYTPSER
jgi:hypothetical protein